MTKTQPKADSNADHFMSPSAVRNFFLWPLYILAVTAVGLLVVTMFGAIWFGPDNDTTWRWVTKGLFVAFGLLIIVFVIRFLGRGKSSFIASMGDWLVQLKHSDSRHKIHDKTDNKVLTAVSENRRHDRSLRNKPPAEIKRRRGSSAIAKNVPRQSSKKKG